MKKYAMILNNLVIDIMESDIPPAFPPDPKGNIGIAVECDDSIKLGTKYRQKNYLNLRYFYKKYKRKIQTSKIQL